MGFEFFNFLIFLAAVLLVYFTVPRRFQWVCLLAASYVFYLAAGLKTAVFIGFTTLTTFGTGLWLGRLNDRHQAALAAGKATLDREQKKVLKARNVRDKRRVLALALVLNFGILVFLKYYNFAAQNLNALLELCHLHVAAPSLGLLLPLGISFYTFQSAGYIIDVYRGTCKPDRNLGQFALFVAFFPQIVQGPISRYSQLAHQLYAPHSFDGRQAKFGIQLMVWGIFKKLVIADRAALLVNTVFDQYYQYQGLVIFMGAVFYCVQIYTDFSGGIDVARGIAQVMGIRLADNFARPYFAVSIADFWRRWHITLSAWMREYIFYPLSLSKAFASLGSHARTYLGPYLGKLFPTMLAMLITFLAVGAWHGSSWKFMAYGLYNGMLIFLPILFAPWTDRFLRATGIQPERLRWRLVLIACTLPLVCFGRYFSRAASFMDAIRMFGRTVQSLDARVLFDGTLFRLGLDRPNFLLLLLALGVLFAVDVLQERGWHLREWLADRALPVRWAVFLAAILTIVIFGVYGLGYDSARFIYARF